MDPKPQRGRPRRRILTEEALEAILLMLSREVNQTEIAEFFGVTKTRINQLARNRANAARVAWLKGERVRHTVAHEQRLYRMLPKAGQVLESSLEGSEKVRSDTARWLHESLIEKPTHRSEVKIQGRIEHDLTPLLQSMNEQMQILREKLRVQNPLDRVRLGDGSMVRQSLRKIEE